MGKATSHATGTVTAAGIPHTPTGNPTGAVHIVNRALNAEFLLTPVPTTETAGLLGTRHLDFEDP